MSKKSLLAELKLEAESTRKIIERIPTDKLAWKPHEKSMSLGNLAHHIAGLTDWANMILSSKELDLEGFQHPAPLESTQEILNLLDEGLKNSSSALENIKDEDLDEIWTLRMGKHIILEAPKKAVIRSLAYNHLYHHRGQLSVYLRLLDVKIPGMYGPSADENS